MIISTNSNLVEGLIITKTPISFLRRRLILLQAAVAAGAG